MHDDLELGTRDKVVTKMTRDGAVEDNLSKGTSTRVSARAEDADFEFGSGDSSGSEEAAVSKTKAQQRRYYRSRDSDSSGSDSAGESDTAYLTVKYGNYTFADVQAELSELFQSQYSISVLKL